LEPSNHERAFEGEGKMNKLTWLEVGMVTEPGQYESRFGLVEITVEDLAVWKQYPRAAFTITGLSPHVEGRILRLGSFELHAESSYSPTEK
jgi:hypothetical protein